MNLMHKISTLITRVALTVLVLSGSFGVIEMATPKNAHAAGILEYTVDSAAAAGGVFARFGPHTNDTNRTNGYGVYPGETVKLLCGVTNGDFVGRYQNTTWHFITDLNNTGEGNFWVSDHYLDTPNAASHLAPGESPCPNETVNPLFVTPNSGFNRTFAVSYAIANAMSAPPADGSCTWFVSNSLWAGGLKKTKQWTDAGQLGSGIPVNILKKLGLYSNFPGTIDAWNVQDFLGYMTNTYSTSKQTLDFSNSRYVPSGAQIGDIVVYDWGQGEGWSHIAIVTLIDPNGLEVSDWSTNGMSPSPVIMRPVTYSVVHHEPLLKEYPKVKAFLLHLYL